jgi:hypothetical protein
MLRRWLLRLLGVVDVGECWSTGPYAMRVVRSHRAQGATPSVQQKNAILCLGSKLGLRFFLDGGSTKHRRWFLLRHVHLGGDTALLCRHLTQSLHHLDTSLIRQRSNQCLPPLVQLLMHRCGRGEVPEEGCGEGWCRRRGVQRKKSANGALGWCMLIVATTHCSGGSWR